MPSPPSQHHHAQRIAAQTAELAFAVPQVVGHRMARMVSSGPQLSDRDRKEFQRMGVEKITVFMESWNAMALQTLRVQQTLSMGLLRSWYTPWSPANNPSHSTAQFHNAALGVLSQGIAPMHRKATANAKRLARTKLW
jgi:hypothetical protein